MLDGSMRTPISISAVIPTYNRARLVERAIESVLAQTYPVAEILVVDDGSVDDTCRAVKAYAGRVRYLYQANAGVSAARNHGVREARYEWVAFLDSDDYWTPGHLGRMAKAIEMTEGKAPLYFSDLRLSAGDGTYWRRCGLEVDGECEFRSDASEWAFMRIQPMMLQASVIRREAYWALRGLPEDLRTREDTLLFYKLALLYPACAVSGCGTVMNSDDNIRLTQVYSPRTQVYQEATVRLFKGLLAERMISSRHRRVLRKRLSSTYFSMGRFMFRKRMVLGAIRKVVIACGVSPTAFAQELVGTLKRNLTRTKREPYEEVVG